MERPSFIGLIPGTSARISLPTTFRMTQWHSPTWDALPGLGQCLLPCATKTSCRFQQPLRVGVVEDRIGKMVGRVTVQEGDGLDGANEAMLQARHYICDNEGSRAAAVEADPGGVVPSERAEIQVRSDRATGAGELVKFGQPVWYRFS